MMKRTVKVKITLKGLALMSAIEAGLIEEKAEGYDLTNFEKFWEAFQVHLLHENKRKYSLKQMILWCITSTIIGCVITKILSLL